MKSHPERENWPTLKFGVPYPKEPTRTELEAAMHQRDPARLPDGHVPLTLDEAVKRAQSKDR